MTTTLHSLPVFAMLWLLNFAFQSTLALGAVYVGTQIFRVRTFRRLEMIWWAVLLGCLITTTLTALALTPTAAVPELDIFFLLWLFAAPLLSAWLWLKSRRFRREIASLPRTAVTDPLTIAIAEELKQAAGIGNICITVSPVTVSPFVVSQKEICLPERALSGLNDEQKESMLAHEIAHIARRDHRSMVLTDIFQVIFFFQPFLCLMRKQLQVIAEYRCDDWTVQKTGSPISLALCLTEVAQWLRETPETAREVSLVGGQSLVVSRVERILNMNQASRLLRLTVRSFTAATLLLLLTTTVPYASAHCIVYIARAAVIVTWLVYPFLLHPQSDKPQLGS